jgi:hypothetical protein
MNTTIFPALQPKIRPKFQVDKDTFVFCIMPRSGSHYTLRLLKHLDRALLHETLDIDPDDQTFGFSYLRGLNINCFLHHYSSPLIDNSIIKKHFPKEFCYWNHLTYGGSPPENFYLQARKIIKPSYSRRITVIFIYRNPLDQAVSTIDHWAQHVNNPNPFIPGKSLIGRDVLEWYFKLFYTHYAALSNPRFETLFLRYEDIFLRPELAWGWLARKILQREKPTQYQRELNVAIAASNYESSKHWEEKFGRSLANDQLKDHPTHMLGGGVGKWKNRVNVECEKTCDYHIRRLNIPKSVFDFG